jgi:hypothetical protein
MVPSIGGGTKLMRTFRSGGTEGVCSGAGGGVVDSSGEIKGEGDSSGIVEEVGVGDSCAATVEAKIVIRTPKLILIAMPSEVSRCCGIFFVRKYREIPPDLRIKLRLGRPLRSE